MCSQDADGDEDMENADEDDDDEGASKKRKVNRTYSLFPSSFLTLFIRDLLQKPLLRLLPPRKPNRLRAPRRARLPSTMTMMQRMPESLRTSQLLFYVGISSERGLVCLFA